MRLLMGLGSRRAKTRVPAMLVVGVAAVTMIASPVANAQEPSKEGIIPEQIEWYAKKFSVSTDEATDRLRAQARAASIARDLQRELGEEYGGVAFDNGTGRFMIGVAVAGGSASKAALASARNVAERLGVGKTADIVEVDDSWSSLEAANARVKTELDDLQRANKVQIGLDSAKNSVVVLVAPEVDDATFTRAQQLTKSTAASVEVDRADAVRFAARPELCQFRNPAIFQPWGWGSYPVCDIPLRGASTMVNSESLCSVGFMTQGPGGTRFVMTAGHCLEGTSTYWQNYDLTPPAGQWAVGYRHSIRTNYGDSGLIRADPWYANNYAHQWVVVPNSTDAYQINGRVSGYTGFVTCHLGANSWRTFNAISQGCGTVGLVGTSVTTTDGRTWGPVSIIDGACGLGGDSGGPVVSYNNAVGIHNGSTGCGPGQWAYYTAIFDAEGALNVVTLTG